jgi:hypothetical protein
VAGAGKVFVFVVGGVHDGILPYSRLPVSKWAESLVRVF